MRYTIIVDVNALSLSQRVEKSIDNGWELLGGVAIATIGDSVVFAQSLTNEQDSPIPPPPPPIDSRSVLEMIAESLKEEPHP